MSEQARQTPVATDLRVVALVEDEAELDAVHERFEALIHKQAANGYRLHSWQLGFAICEEYNWMTKIVAVFEPIRPSPEVPA
jgi:hypothetical protein